MIAGPEMLWFTTRVCSGNYDGTRDNVQLEFKNIFDSDRPVTCMTDYLNYKYQLKQQDNLCCPGRVDWWGLEKVQPCNENRFNRFKQFKPIDGLQFRFHTNTLGLNLHHDQLRLCRVNVQFGRNGSAGYSLWQWDGDLYNEDYTAYNSQSKWATMKKVKG